MSFGFLTLASLLAVGLKTACQARDDRASTQIAERQIEEAKQGTLAAGTTYLDVEGNPSTSARAFASQATFLQLTGGTVLQRLTLRVTPLGAPDRARTYVVVLLPPS